MAQMDNIPIPMPNSSAEAAVVPAFGFVDTVSPTEREFLDRLPEAEQQSLLENCSSEQQLHQRIQQAMQKQ